MTRWLLVALVSASVGACTRKAAEEQPVETGVPVHVAEVVKTTLHRFVKGVGTVTPEPASGDKPAAGAQIAALIPGIVAQARSSRRRRSTA